MSENSKALILLIFLQKFKEKYNIEPSLYASKGYELARVII